MMDIDVLCVGATAYDLTFTVDQHPQPDEKLFAASLVTCGGGPAANAAVTVVRLGGTAVFSGYLGNDIFGDRHLAELQAEGVLTDWIVRGSYPSPVSTIIAKPNGTRALIAYQGDTPKLAADAVDFANIAPRVILFDGHEPHLSRPLAARAKEKGIPTILDAGSRHAGTEQLAGMVDYLVCSIKFARQMSQKTDAQSALQALSHIAPAVVVTMGERGLLWLKNGEMGQLPAFPVPAVDTTGAGDTFHGAFAYCLARGKSWLNTLTVSSAAAALCCTRHGARHGIPRYAEVMRLHI